jgi:hypothetical protein
MAKAVVPLAALAGGEPPRSAGGCPARVVERVLRALGRNGRRAARP